jgi:plasmid maintenance system antidote protein VapI
MVAKLLDTPEHRAIFERERSIGSFLVGIQDALSDLSVSKSKLAEMTGKKATAISRAMQGKQNLTIGTMVDLAVALGKQVEIRVVDLDKIEVATNSSAQSNRLNQAWATEYFSNLGIHTPYRVNDQVVQGVACSIS